MAYTAKSYVDITGLTEFLTKLKTAYGSNTSSASDAFKVNYAQHAVAASKAEGDQDTIANTYLKQTDAASTYAAKALKIGDGTGTLGTDYVTLSTDITKAQLQSVLGIDGDGAKANVIETVKVWDNGQQAAVALTPDANKAVTIDLHNYATLDDITKMFRYKGSKATVAALPSSGMVEGDVWHVVEDDGEYVYIGAIGEEGQSGYEAAHWELISHNLSNYYTKSEVYNKTEINNKELALQSSINAIYVPGTPAQGDPEDPDYVPAVPASGYLATEITRAQTAEGALDTRVTSLENSIGGNIDTKIATALAALDAEEVGGAGKYIAAISETDGVITATAANLASSVASDGATPVTGSAVYTYVGTEIATALGLLDINNNGTAVGDAATASYVKVVDQDNGLVTATAGAFTTYDSVNGLPALADASDITAPTTKAVVSGDAAVYAAITSVTNSEIDALFPSAS